MSDDDKKPFTVTDRRHFNPEGESRADDVADAEPLPVPTAPAPEASSEVDEPGEGDDPGGPMVPTDLAGLVVMLATQASMMLSPGEGGPDIEAARGFIGLLEMLREKTAGNRTAEEDRLLEEVLYRLRIEFVARQRGRA